MLASPAVPGFLAVALLLLAAAQAPAPSARAEAAAVVFPSSGAASAQPAFLRGVTALHNFQYEDADEAFREAQGLDRDFALAYWGQAMAYNQTLWLNQDLDMARQILQRLAPTAEARATKAKTDRERGFLAALEALIGPGEKGARDHAYAEAMGRLAAAFPEDLEVLSFQALALMGTAVRSPALFRDGGDDKHQHALVGSSTQKQVAAILDKVLARKPHHPGALHYLIHNYDDPDHARLALPAARGYAKVAAESSHALHMPAHIFVQLGMWPEAAASDEHSFRASENWVKRKKLPPSMRDFHSLSWLLYESLQRGRYQRAREALEILGPVVKEAPAARLKSVLSDMRARYVVETRSYAELAAATNFDTTGELFAIGLSAARHSDGTKAAMALAELGRRAGGRSGGGRSLDVAVMEKELDAVMAVMAGRGADAITRLQEAVALERELPPPLGPPRPIKPASELFGEILLELGRPREAAAQFEAALARWSNRSPALLGLGRAHAALGDPAAARSAYQRFLANWSQADPGLPELEEAQRFRGAASQPRGQP